MGLQSLERRSDAGRLLWRLAQPRRVAAAQGCQKLTETGDLNVVGSLRKDDLRHLGEPRGREPNTGESWEVLMNLGFVQSSMGTRFYIYL